MSHAGVDVLPYNVRLNDPSPNINPYFACDSAIVTHFKNKRSKKYEEFLRATPALQKLTPVQLARVADALEE